MLVGIALISSIILTQALPAIPEGQLSSGDPGSIAVMNQNSEDQNTDPSVESTDEPFDIRSFLRKYFGKPKANEDESLAENCTENETLTFPPTDDEIFQMILRNESFSFNLLSLQCIIALDQGDQNTLKSNAARLHDLAVDLHEQVEPLEVEPHHYGRKALFLESMGSFIDVTGVLKEGLPHYVSERRAAYLSLTSAIERLDNVIRNINCQTVPPGTTEDVTGLEVMPEVLRPDDILPAGMPAIYRDATNSNEISIYPQYARKMQSLYYEERQGLGFATRHLNAAEGRSYIMVYMVVTHRGNMDGKKYTIQTPALSAFTLHGPEESYKPVSTPEYTSLGEMYTQKTLDRKESTRCSLLFEVPEDLIINNAYISANLGSGYGTISWNLT
ncbi:hypothetical protein [Methanocalculus sp.]|uniref:hypothetical protein n=1 Tax=Methanocalculus sp. TaxID=2004547 RepID=UPI00271DC12D|nr:hypothetical protein [Methanocalculus sp.]MDO8842276.1 hypothetical protein [Methanocalculus sp.]